jgi:hypothetical protein
MTASLGQRIVLIVGSIVLVLKSLNVDCGGDPFDHFTSFFGFIFATIFMFIACSKKNGKK